MQPHLQHNIITSGDGTGISYYSSGNGPGIIIVPGVMAVAENYNLLAQLLSRHFTVHVIERRGRGLSGEQGKDYTIAKECEDIEAIKNVTLADYIFGHSYGGLIALEASLHIRFKKVAVYEPAVSMHRSINTEWLPVYIAHLGNNEHLDALAVFVQGAGPAAVNTLPLWLIKMGLWFKLKKEKRNSLYRLLPANLWEHRVIENKNDTYEYYKSINIKTLVMYGGNTKLHWPVQTSTILRGVIPLSDLKVFPMLDHFGPEKSPGDIAAVITDFLL